MYNVILKDSLDGFAQKKIVWMETEIRWEIRLNSSFFEDECEGMECSIEGGKYSKWVRAHGTQTKMENFRFVYRIHLKKHPRTDKDKI